jgi:hypothetical protein
MSLIDSKIGLKRYIFRQILKTPANADLADPGSKLAKFLEPSYHSINTSP